MTAYQPQSELSRPANGHSVTGDGPTTVKADTERIRPHESHSRTYECRSRTNEPHSRDKISRESRSWKTTPQITMKPKRYWKGARAEYTGVSAYVYGTTAYELRLLSGSRKGDIVWTTRKPPETERTP